MRIDAQDSMPPAVLSLIDNGSFGNSAFISSNRQSAFRRSTIGNCQSADRQSPTGNGQ
jgi:hypothetical protein